MWFRCPTPCWNLWTQQCLTAVSAITFFQLEPKYFVFITSIFFVFWESYISFTYLHLASASILHLPSVNFCSFYLVWVLWIYVAEILVFSPSSISSDVHTSPGGYHFIRSSSTHCFFVQIYVQNHSSLRNWFSSICNSPISAQRNVIFSTTRVLCNTENWLPWWKIVVRQLRGSQFSRKRTRLDTDARYLWWISRDPSGEYLISNRL